MTVDRSQEGNVVTVDRSQEGNVVYSGSLLLQLCVSLLLRKLQMVQNSAARLITGTRRRVHITPVLFSLHRLTVLQRMEFKLLLLVFRTVHHRCPVYNIMSYVVSSDSIHTHPNTVIRRSTSIDYTAVLSRAVRSSGLFCGRADNVERPASRS